MTTDDNGREDKRVKKIAKIFANAQATIDSIDVSQDGTLLVEDAAPVPMVVTPIGEKGELFELVEIKASFVEARRGLQQLIHKGQRLMNQTMALRLRDMTASQVEAISSLSNTVSTQMALMIEMYKTIIEIEQARNPALKGMGTAVITTGDNTQIQQNTIFVGDTAELIKHLNQPKKVEQ